MGLQKQAISINFASGLETFTDPNQLSAGQFTALSNAIFVREGQSSYAELSKRNGFGSLTTLPDNSSTYLASYQNGLIAIGQDLKSYAAGPNSWYNFGNYIGLNVSVTPIVRNGVNQIAFDSAISGNGLVCFSYIENSLIGSATIQATQKVIVSDSTTGQTIMPAVQLSSTIGTVSTSRMSRVFSLGSQFGVIFETTNSGSSNLEYVTINQASPLSISSNSTITRNYAPTVCASSSAYGTFDAVVSSSTLFVGWYSVSSGGLFATQYTSNLTRGSTARCGSATSVTMLSISTDNTLGSGTLYSYWATIDDLNGGSLRSFDKQMAAYSPIDYNFNSLGAVSQRYNTQWINNIGAAASGGSFIALAEIHSVIASSTFASKIYAGGISSISVAGDNYRLASGQGLASKPYFIGSQFYFLGVYNSTYQSTYFLNRSTSSASAFFGIDSSRLPTSQIIGKLANGNGNGWLTYGLPSIPVIASTSYVGYLVKDSITSVNKNTNVSSTTQTSGIYSQTGINLAKLTLSKASINTAEAGNNLHINGGMVWRFDGSLLDEAGFNVYPDFIIASTLGSGGQLSSQTYFYVSTYEYVDNKGNIIRSAPSVPVSITTSGSGGGLSVNTLIVPTYQLSSRDPRILKTNLYRWSTAQQNYFKVASAQNPVNYFNGAIVSGVPPNSYTAPSVTFTDTQSDANIIGNELLYTTGGVVEDDGPPACSNLTIFDSRLWMINAEDPNTLWFSKTILETTPAEFSALLTIFIPPALSGQSTTGPMKCISAMDDKLIIFKNNSIYYINGTGPDNTGANSQYSQPILITNGVGCSTQSSIVLIPRGLMFKSNKGIWVLGRDLSVEFIGKSVEIYDSANVLSANLISGTNQVRLILDSGVMLMYDYFVNQWGTFSINGLSSIVYNGIHTYLDSSGNVFQETPNTYSDGSTSVVMSFTTGWINLDGLQSYKRLYRMYMLGNYKAPHSLLGQIAYDFNPAIQQSFTINPTNTIGSGSQVEQWQMNFSKQQCQSFQLSMTEVSSVSAGQGLTISGLRIVAGMKSEEPRNIGVGNKIS